MNRSLSFYTLGLAGSLIFAYYSSMPKSDSGDDSVDWVNFPSDSVESVTLESAKVNLSANARSTGGFWIKMEQTVADAKTDSEHGGDEKADLPSENPVDAAKPEGPEPAGKQVKIKEFKAGEGFNDLVSSFAPLKAKRVIGDAKSLDTKEFGFDSEDVMNLKVKTKDGKELKLKIGKKAYGSSNLFALDEEKGKVILVRGNRIEDLAKADQRMYERNIFKAQQEDVKKARVTAGEKNLNLDHSVRDEHGNFSWKQDKEGAAAEKIYTNWMDKIWRLKLIEFADVATNEQLNAAATIFELSFFDEHKEIEKIVLKKIVVPGEAGQPNKINYWIKTDFLGSFAKIDLNKAEAIEKDLPSLLAAVTE
ncbi:MAG: DUF4340 domain-containing protein [Oligoflexales bacterium]